LFHTAIKVLNDNLSAICSTCDSFKKREFQEYPTASIAFKNNVKITSHSKDTIDISVIKSITDGVLDDDRCQHATNFSQIPSKICSNMHRKNEQITNATPSSVTTKSFWEATALSKGPDSNHLTQLSSQNESLLQQVALAEFLSPQS
jgi:hypothetical protein